jgi:REP element-mobilizing transposase RayT
VNKLKEEGHYIIGYVIMPNHIHFILGYKNCGQLIKTRIGTLKRFLAYDLVNLIKEKGDKEMLHILSEGVTKTDKERGKLHQVLKPY